MHTGISHFVSVASIQLLSASFSEDLDRDLILKALIEKNTSSVHNIAVMLKVKNGSRDDNGRYLNVYPEEYVIPPIINQLTLFLSFAEAEESSLENLLVVTLELFLPSGQPDIVLGAQTTIQIQLTPGTN